VHLAYTHIPMKSLIFLGLLLAALLAAFLVLQQAPEPSVEVAAMVNGQSISVEEVDRAYARLTPEQQQELGRAYALDFLIEKTLLLQEAKRLDIEGTQEEVNVLYTNYLRQNDLTFETLEEQLLAQGSDIPQFRALLAEQAAINSVLAFSETPFSLSVEEVRANYDLLYTGTNVSFEDAEQSIIDRITLRERNNQHIRAVNTLKQRATIAVYLSP
jgi:hypothetical protein